MKNYMELSAEYYKMGLNTEALDYGNKCLVIAKDTDDQHAEMNACLVIGKAYSALKQYDEAINYGNVSLVIAKETGDKEIENETSFLLGETYYKFNHLEEAVVYFERCRDILEETGNKDREMQLRLKLVEVYHFLTDVKYRDPKIDSYMELSAKCYKMGQNTEAIIFGKKCIGVAKETDNQHAEMKACLAIGKAFSEFEQCDETIPYALRCLKIARKTGDKEIENETLFLLGETYFKLKRLEEAVVFLDVCINISDKAGDKNRQMLARLKLEKIYELLTDVKYREAKIDNYKELSTNSHELGEYNEARRYGSLCISTARESGIQRADLNACLVVCGVYRDIAKKNGDKELENELTFLLGEIHFKSNQDEEAIYYFEMCYKISKDGGNKEGQMQACFKLTEVYGSMPYLRQDVVRNHIDLKLALLETFPKIMFYCKECIDIAKEIGDKEHEMQASHLLGNIYHQLNRLDDAIPCYKRSIAIAKETENREKEMVVVSHLADSYNVLNRNEEAKLQEKRAFNIAKELEESNEAIPMPTTLDNSLNIENKTEIGATKLFPIAKETGDTLSEIERSLMTLQNASDMEDQFHNYLQQRYKDHLFGIFVGDSISSFNSLEVLLNFIQHILTALIKDRNFVTSLLERIPMLANVEYNIEIFDEIFHNLKSDTMVDFPGLESVEARLKRMEKYKNKLSIPLWCLNFLLIMKECLNIFLSIFETVDIHDYKPRNYLLIGMTEYLLEESINAIASLKESISCFESIFRNLHNVDKSKISLFDKYVDAYKLLSKIYIEEDKKEEALLVSERSRSRSLKDILKYGMKQDVVIDDGNDIQLTDIQSLVKTNKFSIVFYSVCLNDLHTFLIDGNGLHFSSQPLQGFTTCELEKYIEKAFQEMNVRQVVNSKNFNQDTETNQKTKETSAQSCSDFRFRGKPSENSDESSFTNALEVLYNKLLGEVPIEQDEIVIIPDGPLFNVPFAALRDPDTGRYLSEDKKIRLAPSLTTLKLLSDRLKEDRKKVALVIGDPEVGKVMFDGKEEIIKRLENAHVEAIVMGYRYGVKPLIGSAATKPSVIEKLQQGEYSVVHIAAHGDLDKATILLAPTPETRKDGKIPDEEDYMLTMADVQKARVSAQLIVLSCCYSGRGKIRAEGVVGMCRAFLASGARAVVASLWAIEDEATNEFMSIFSENLRMGKSASMSLHLTMNEMRTTSLYNRPKHWAPFFLMGDDVMITS